MSGRRVLITYLDGRTETFSGARSNDHVVCGLTTTDRVWTNVPWHQIRRAEWS